MTVETSCWTCGKLFVPRAGGKPQVRCSAKCRRQAANATYVQKRAPQRATACAECGGPVIQLALGRPRQFCSDQCKARCSNRRVNRARPPLASPTQKTCAHCGAAFVARSRDRIYCYEKKYCAQLAYRLRVAAGLPRRVTEHEVKCDGCGTAFVAKHPLARWCSKACANRHWGGVRARQRQRPSGAKYTDLEIFERDGWRCHLCRKRVRRDVKRLHPDGATIDHLVPISLGGVDEPSNVATAHWKCNRDKRARAMNEQLALL